MSIAVEATLRDVLSKKGYGHVPRASKVDIYKDSSAQIDASVGFYTVTFLDPMLESPADLSTSAGGSVPIDIQIRRVVNLNNARVDLLIKAPHYLMDHWSSDKVATAGQSKSIGGLGEALQSCSSYRKSDHSLDLPTDVDQVLTAVKQSNSSFEQFAGRRTAQICINECHR